jgi:hypothetical protein
MSPRSFSKDDKAKLKVAMKIANEHQKLIRQQQDEKNVRTQILHQAALIVRAEQKNSLNGRLRRGFLTELVNNYHYDDRQVWVTKHMIQYAVQKMKALDRGIPRTTKKFHPAVATINVRMGSSASVVSSLGLYGAENTIHHSLLSQSSVSTTSSESTISTVSTESSVSTTSSGSTESSVSTTSSVSTISSVSMISTLSAKQAQQEEKRQRDEKDEEERRKRHEKYEEDDRKRREKHEEYMQRMSKAMASMVQLSRDCLEAEKSNNSTLKRTLETKMFRTMFNAFQFHDEVYQEFHSKFLKMLDM